MTETRLVSVQAFGGGGVVFMHRESRMNPRFFSDCFDTNVKQKSLFAEVKRNVSPGEFAAEAFWEKNKTPVGLQLGHVECFMSQYRLYHIRQ